VTACSWHSYVTGASLCNKPAAYWAWFADCAACGPDCTGAPVCVDHAAVVRERDDLLRMSSIDAAVVTAAALPIVFAAGAACHYLWSDWRATYPRRERASGYLRAWRRIGGGR
jgi:hypothetical protein